MKEPLHIHTFFSCIALSSSYTSHSLSLSGERGEKKKKSKLPKMKARHCKSLQAINSPWKDKYGHLETIVMHGTMNNINMLNPSKFGIHGQREIFHVAEIIYTSIQFGNKSSIVMVACL
ncbi:hypothetical protein ACB092_02G078400 [Castanea dentata]